MLEQYYVRPDTIDRIRSLWIGEAVEKYVGWLTDRKYSWKSVSRRIPVLVRFGGFAQQRGATKLKQLCDHVEPFVQMWARGHVREGMSAAQRKKIVQQVRNPIQQMLRLVVPGFVGRGRLHWPENPFHDQVPHLMEHLREEKGLREASILHYQHYLRRFASYLQRIGLKNLAHLTPAVLSGFVADYGRRIGWASLRNAVGVLRVFLRYLRRLRILSKDLTGAIE